MQYEREFVASSQIPRAAFPQFQHVVDTYAGETNKTPSTWMQFNDADLDWKPHAKSASVAEIMRHQILSERRFFSEFLGSDEPPVAGLLPETKSVQTFADRFVQLASSRLAWLAALSPQQWQETRPFFDVERERIWIFWRRVLHSAHHRTQLSVYLRLLEKPVVPSYGPTADITWDGASPTL